jgi:hypothetical protein
VKTAREIYERSLALLGQENGENTEHFQKKAPLIINLLLAQLLELDLALKGEDFSSRASVPQIRDLEEVLGYEDVILLSLLPVGLASFLIQEEEPERSAFFLQIYQREKETLRQRCRKGRRHKIGRGF